jgi:hypothetical protein
LGRQSRQRPISNTFCLKRCCQSDGRKANSKHLPVKGYNSLRVASGLALADSRRVARQVLGYKVVSLTYLLGLALHGRAAAVAALAAFCCSEIKQLNSMGLKRACKSRLKQMLVNKHNNCPRTCPANSLKETHRRGCLSSSEALCLLTTDVSSVICARRFGNTFTVKGVRNNKFSY